MGRLQAAKLLLPLLLLAPARGEPANPPNCARDITGLIATLTEAGQYITYTTDQCILMYQRGFGLNIDSVIGVAYYNNPAICANDISTVVADFASAASGVASAAFDCGNVESGCAQQVFSAIADVGIFSEDITSAVQDCQVDAWSCVGDVFDAMADFVTFAQQIVTGLELCIGFVPALPPGYSYPDDDGYAGDADEEAPEPIPDGEDYGDDAGAPEPEAGAPEPEPELAAGPRAASTLSDAFFPGASPVGPMERRRLQDAQGERQQGGPKELVDIPREQARKMHAELKRTLAALGPQLESLRNRVRMAALLEGKALPESARPERRSRLLDRLKLPDAERPPRKTLLAGGGSEAPAPPAAAPAGAAAGGPEARAKTRGVLKLPLQATANASGVPPAGNQSKAALHGAGRLSEQAPADSAVLV